jgi:hypothetical protein
VAKSRRFDGAPETARDKRGFDLATAGAKLPRTLRGLLDVIRAAEPGCFCDPELFTGPAGVDDEPPEDEAARVAVARQVCASCPARLACLAYALRTRPAAGVWAGCTTEEIRSLAAASPVTRP